MDGDFIPTKICVEVYDKYLDSFEEFFKEDESRRKGLNFTIKKRPNQNMICFDDVSDAEALAMRLTSNIVHKIPEKYSERLSILTKIENAIRRKTKWRD